MTALKIGILETIVTPAGHEVEFDKILVDGIKKAGHTPIFTVPERFPFKMDYGAEIKYLTGGEAISYAGVGKLKKLWLSLQRERRRIAWFNSAHELANHGDIDTVLVPTCSWRSLRSLRNSKLVNSTVPVVCILHGIMPSDRERVIREAQSLKEYKNIHIAILGPSECHPSLLVTPNVHSILGPVYTPSLIDEIPRFNPQRPLRLGFFGQYRKEKNLEFFLEGYKAAQFSVPVELLVQGATMTIEDGEDFDRIACAYASLPGIKFLHKNLIGAEWQRTLMNCDVVLLPYGAERYLYQPSAMLFTAIGYQKVVLQSPELNPEIIKAFTIGDIVPLSDVTAFTSMLQNFVNTFYDKADEYKQGLEDANKYFSQEKLIQSLLCIMEEKK